MFIFLIDSRRRRIPGHPPHFIPHFVDHGLPQVRLERAFVTRLEVIDVPDPLRQSFLDEILRVPEIPGPSGQTTTRPSTKRRPVANNQVVQRLGVARSGASQ